MDQFIEYMLGEFRVVGDAPAVFLATILVTGGVIWGAMRWRCSRIIENKDAIIQVKEAIIENEAGTIALYKERLNDASPDQAKAKIDSLEGQIMSLKDREWPKLTPGAVADLENSLKTLDRPQIICILPQDRDSTFLARDLVDAFTRIGWAAKRSTSMNGVPDGLSVWPDNDLGSAIRDALAKATGAPVALREDKHSKEHGRILIGVGYRTAEVTQDAPDMLTQFVEQFVEHMPGTQTGPHKT